MIQMTKEMYTKKRVERILNRAYDEVPYFNNIINDHIKDDDELTADLLPRLPIFTKQTIREIGWENFVSGSYLDDKYLPISSRNVRLERTSGTTGIPMHILWDAANYYSSIINHWKYRKQHFNIDPSSRLCTTSKHIPGNNIYYIKGNQLTFSIRELNTETMPQIFEVINKYEPDWMFIQNSILYVLVRAAKKMGLTFPKSIKYIEYMGEPLCEYYRREIAKEIVAKTSNMYGCVETNGISYECPCGNNHIISENVYVEIVNEEGNPIKNGNPGYVCVTGLHNTGMPMIRYRLNDIARMYDNPKCQCGNTNPIIHIEAARMPEFIILDDISVYEKAQIISPINAGMKLYEVQSDDILFNIEIRRLDEYKIHIYKNFQQEINFEKLFLDIFKSYGLPNIRFEIVKSDTFYPSKPAGFIRLR
ncbi:MAG: phenylacetate--CoA ligase family protein [Ruminococcaceae bacterium]|nr:phenylacetate--CoA ligase family protein [Oscillospiraceae bacterium]